MSNLTNVPLNLVGVDPFYYSHLKLMIGHVHQIVKNQITNHSTVNQSVNQPLTTQISNPWIDQSLFLSRINRDQSVERYPPGTLMFGGHLIRQVEIVGLIVSLRDRNKSVEYFIDDGTDVIRCEQWVETPQADDPTAHQWVYQSSDQANFQKMYQSMRTVQLRLGYLVRVLGRIDKDGFLGTTIRVTSVHRLTDPNAELLHAIECMRLYPTYQSIDPNLLAVNNTFRQAAR